MSLVPNNMRSPFSMLLLAGFLAACTTTPDADGMVDVAMGRLEPPDNIQVAVVGGSDDVAARYPVGSTFLASELVCLPQGAHLSVVAQGLDQQLRGPGCDFVYIYSDEEFREKLLALSLERLERAEAEQRARAEAEQRAREEQQRAREQAEGKMTYGLSGGTLKRSPPAQVVAPRKVARKICPDGSSVAASASCPVVRQMTVIRGSPGALAWYPLNSKVDIGARVCLPKGSGSLTFQPLGGGALVTVEGGTCRASFDDLKKTGQRGGGGNGP
ncbi:MAG: hypothetical protein H6920_00600 [Sphingomonadaceae bacterium]|nr:hypothetical protein [Altererythrobacter sp.]MCP5390114.1 hypothetical protein [Sphingomonadaceae bacterium]MCP5392553.1 hypothetical protein [Sphingomonadaceae bacterium]